MAVAMMVDNPEGTQEIFGRVRERLGLENAAGGIFHAALPAVPPRARGRCSLAELRDVEQDL